MRLVSGPLTYEFNRLYTGHNADFLNADEFKAAYETASIETGFRHPAPWRVYVNCWAIKRAVNECKGDLVECGTWLGTTALTGMLYANYSSEDNDKRFYLVDSWEGIDQDNLLPGESVGYASSKKERYSGVFEQVKKIFSSMKNVVLVKGFVPGILNQVDANLIAYLHLDMNSATPEIEALRYFWPKLSPGAVVVLDDYGFSGHEAQKTAIDALCISMNTQALSLPTGQGLIIKP